MTAMSYIHKPAFRPMESRTFSQLLDIHASLNPTREAFVFYDNEGKRSAYTFHDLKQQSLFLAASFLRLNLTRGTRAVVMVPNEIEFVVCYLALNRLGVNAMLLQPSGKAVEDVVDILRDFDCHSFIFHPSDDDSYNFQLMESARKIMAASQIVLVSQKQAAVSKEGYSFYSDLLNLGEQLGNASEVLKQQDEVQFEDPAAVLFTSGSTGKPKGVQYTNHALVNGALIAGIKVFEVAKDTADAVREGTPPLDQGSTAESQRSEHRLFFDRPLYWACCHCAGMSTVFVSGCTLVMTPPVKSATESDTDFILKVLEDERCTAALLMPYLITDLVSGTHIEPSSYNLDALKVVVTAGQPISLDKIEKLKVFLPSCRISNYYGMTEVGFGISLGHVAGPGIPIRCDVGMEVLNTIELKITNADEKLLPRGQLGEICIRCPFSFSGYLEGNEVSAKAVCPNRWIHTADIGRLDEHGSLHFVGRQSDMIKKAGEKIIPAEIEKVLIKYPDVKDAVVIGVPDERLYEELCACVVPKAGSTLESGDADFQEWMDRQWSADELGLSLRPGYTLVMDKFPMTGTGKTDRKTLKIVAAQTLKLK